MKRILITVLTIAILAGVCSFCAVGADSGIAAYDAAAGEATEDEATAFPFWDVPSSRWSNPYVALLYYEGIVDGMTPHTFVPADNVTRAQFVKILCGAAGGQTEGAEHTFEDVEADSWYEPYVAWAAEQGIVDGVAPGRFAPDAFITRQDMATMIYRYMTKVLYAESAPIEPIAPIAPIDPIGPITPVDPEEPPIVLPVEPEPEPEIMSISGEETEESGIPKVNEPIEFTDGEQIADYAADAVSSMQQAGILGGVPNGDGTYRFEPKNNATREQAAKMLGELFLIINEDKTLPEPVDYAVYRYFLYDAKTDWYLQGQDFRSQGTLDPAEDLTLPTPVKYGYVFDGWSGPGIDGIVKDAVVKKGTVFENARYYADFTPVEYKIEYVLNGGVMPEGYVTSYTLETADQYIPTPYRDGYIFMGWYVNGSDELRDSFKIVQNDTNGDLRLEAYWRENSDSAAACVALGEWINTAELDNEYMSKKDELYHPEGCDADIRLALPAEIEGADESYLTFCYNEESGVSAIYLVYEKAQRKYVIEMLISENAENSVTISACVWNGAEYAEQPTVSVEYSSEGFKGLTVVKITPDNGEESETNALMNDVTDFLEMKGFNAVCGQLDAIFAEMGLTYTWESFK